MATILEITKTGALRKLDAELSHRQQELRCLYATPKLVQWIENDLLHADSQHNLEQSPAEQVDALLEVYCSGEVLDYGWAFKEIKPIEHGVWEFKTADVRIFGWFHRVDVFVGVIADFKWRILENRLYAVYRNEVSRFMAQINPDEPKCLMGGVEDGVISNFDYPNT
jgi:hypothetical protein